MWARYLRLMNPQAMLAQFRRLPPFLVDGLVAIALLAIDVGTWMTTPQPDGGVRDSKAIALAVLILGSVPVAWRRRFPLTVLSLTFLALTAHEALGFPKAPILGPYFALYSAGAHRELRPSAAVTAIAVGAYYAAYLSEVIRGAVPPLAIVHNFALVIILWGLGASVRKTRKYAAELEDRATRLEREREEKARRAVADERARIARDLHDVVAHHVSVMVVQAGGARRVLKAQPAQARSALESIEATGRQALAEMRRLLGVLRTNGDGARPLEPRPGIDQLESLVAQLADAGLTVELAVEGEPRPLPAGVDLSAYRIIQEALTNTLKHAGPARARTVVRYRDSDLEIEVTDNGRGGSDGREEAPGHGQGLVGMRERAALFGGELRAGPRPGGGYSVTARLPLDAAAQ